MTNELKQPSMSLSRGGSCRISIRGAFRASAVGRDYRQAAQDRDFIACLRLDRFGVLFLRRLPLAGFSLPEILQFIPP